jgi:hypothetical protein
MRFKLTPHCQGHKPIGKDGIDGDCEFEFGACFPSFVRGRQSPYALIALEVSRDKIRMDGSRYHTRFCDQSALSGQQSVVNTQIGGHDASGNVQIDDPHPYFKEIWPMRIVGKQRSDEIRAGRKYKPGRCDDSTGRIRFDVKIFLGSVSRGRKAWPQAADAEDEQPDRRRYPTIASSSR